MMLRRIKTLGILLGRDFGKTLARATKAREAGGCEAALAVLDEALGQIHDDEELRAHSDYAATRLLHAECLAERGLKTGSVAEVLAGVRVLVRAHTVYRACLMGGNETRLALLAKADRLLQSALDPAWQPAGDKSVFREELGQLASAWNTLERPADAVRVAESGLGIFPGDTDLLLALGEAAACRGDLAECFRQTTSALARGGLPASPAKVISLLELLQKGSDRALAEQATAWAGEVYRRLKRWDQAFETLLQAQGKAGDALEDFAVEALLVTCARRRAYRELEQYGRQYIERGMAPASLTVAAAAIRELIESFPERKHLWLIWAEASLILGREADALTGFQQALALDRLMAADILTALRTLGDLEAVAAGLRVTLARAFLAGGETDLGLDMLRYLSGANARPEELAAATGLCRDLLGRQPDHQATVECLLHLQMAQRDWAGAVDTARRRYEQTGDAEVALGLAERVATAAVTEGVPAAELAARQFEIEVWQGAGDGKAALAALRRLGEHPAATPDVLAWTVERLGAFEAVAGAAGWARLARGDIWRRQGQPRQAGEDYLAVLAQQPAADLLEAACSGLGRVWTAAADRGRARAALARGWLVAGRPTEARAPLIECLEVQHEESMSLLELLRARQAQHPGSDEWVTLGIEAGLAIGVESNLAAVAESLYRLLELRPERAAWVEETARQLAVCANADETREAAVLVQARAGVVCGNCDGIERLCQWLAEAQPPWRANVADVIQEAAESRPASTQARLCIALGRMLALGRGDENRAARCFEQAAALSPAEWGETAITEVGNLTARSSADPGLALATARTAYRLGRGESACSELLRLLERLRDTQVPEARDMSRQVIRDQPESPRALLLLARCEARLGQLAAAVAAYRQLIRLRDASLHEIALGDLALLQQANPADFAVFDAWLEALDVREAGAEVRQALLQRLLRLPAQAGECVERLRQLHRARPASWEDTLALAEGLRLAGRAPEAVDVWREVLAQDGVDWEAAAAALRQLAVLLPRDFVAAVLLLRAELRSLSPELLVEPLQRLERVLSLPGREEVWLSWLLEDCSRAEHRAGGQGAVARLALTRRAEIRALLGQGAAAAAELERLVREWPADARVVAALCQRELDAGHDAVYLRPLARARFLAGDGPGGVAALRQLIDALPEQAAEASAVCQDYAARAQGRDAEAVQFLGADLAARGGEYSRAAQEYLTLVRRAPVLTAEVTARLSTLVTQGVTAPEVHTALAELDLDGQPERLNRAFAILKRFLEPDVERRAGAVLPLIRAWKAQYPRSAEPRLQLLWLLFRRSPPPVSEIETEARGLLADFGADGARAFISFCAGELAVTRLHAPFWHLLGAAHELVGDLPGSLACLRTLLRIDFAVEAPGVERHALGLRRNGVLPGGALELLAELARQAGDGRKAAIYATEAVEQPDANLPTLRAGILALLETDPANATARCALARCEWREGRGAAAAAQYRRAGALPGAPDLSAVMRQLCDEFPDVALGWLARGEGAFQRQDPTQALAALNRAAELPGLEPADQVLLWRMLAECHVAEHRFDQAASYVRRLIEANPADDQAARRLMELHFEKTEHELALAREAIQTGGETPDLAYKMGCLLQARGDYDDAARWFRKVPREHALANRSLIESGRCRLALNQGHLATAAFKAALGNAPGEVDRCAALYQLGMAYSRLLDFERAGQAFEELCVLNPDYEDAARQLQVCQEQLARGEKMRLAEVPFDLLTAWRDATARPAAPARPPVTPPLRPAAPVPRDVDPVQSPPAPRQ